MACLKCADIDVNQEQAALDHRAGPGVGAIHT